jgi:hypothetical protein
VAVSAWWLDERCGAVEQVREELHALRAHNLARVLVDERICAVTQNAAFRYVHFLELFAPHGLHREPPQPRYRPYNVADGHLLLLMHFAGPAKLAMWPDRRERGVPQIR